MKTIELLVWGMILSSCSNSQFSAQSENSSPAETVDAIPAKVDQQPEPENDSDDTGAAELKECLLAVGGDLQSVVSISQGDVDLSQITPDSVLYLQVQGQANIDLAEEDIAQLKGVCIEATGIAEIRLDLNAVVTAMYYYARGGASASLNFRDTGQLDQLTTNVSGASSLALSGNQLVCDDIVINNGGASIVECNGASLK
jgi:predicted  nucleic acid-binding Zn-ribbon protein